ncbi:MAG TPA: flagellar hook capping FlgD N-terminal domain-containing protein [Anaeromyxobacteraceae bacterium]|nr:flagellar hook capping FlgD N-terminal domain-containing protein [Anaeromyxobacteraceae bacterium]
MSVSPLTTNNSTSAAQIAAATSGSSSASSATGSSALGENDFLTLLTTELQNQDPTQPVDDTQFVAELAQFSSLEQLQNIGTQLNTLITASSSSSEMAAASLIGKQVAYDATGVDLVSGTPPSIQVQLASPAAVTAVVTDSSGSVVKSLNLGYQNAGVFSLGWDGTNSSGTALPSGSYGLSLTATASDGSAVSVQAQAMGTVQGVTYSNNTPEVVIGTQVVPLSNVIEITQ